MIGGNKLRALVWLSLAFWLAPSPELLARSRKGDKFLKLARDAEARKDYDTALDYYNQALSENPSDPSYELGMRRVRFQSGELHVRAGQKLRDSGKLEEALTEFQKAFATDPSSPIALQEIKRTMEMLERNKAGGVPPAEATLTPADLERQKAQERIESLSPVPQLKPITSQITNLKMNNQPPKVLYETVGKLAGVNVVFDPQFQFSGKNVNLDLTNSTLEEALDYIALQTKTFWKPISANTIFVAEDNVAKRRDYDDQVVKVFYLKNVTSIQEFQEIVTAVRSITDIHRMFTYGAQNAVMCRGTVDQIALAEKLFHDVDKPKSEVVVDLIVMEANRDKTRAYAAGLVSGGKTGLVIPVGFTPRGGTTIPNTPATPATPTNPTTPTTPTTPSTPSGSSTGTSISVSQIGKVSFSDFSLSLPGALLQAVMSDNQTRVLQSPQVRASDGQKVSLRIGDKVPYATGSFQPGIGTVGVSPLVSTQFQFAEVGVSLDVTPHVHGNDELTLKIVIEISNVSRNVTIGGVDQPVISQRKSDTEIRLRDGEISLLGGLLQGQESNAVSGIPGLVNVPVLGKLFFGSSNKDVSRGELLIALIPHIVRGPSVQPIDMRGVAAGSDQVVKLMHMQQHAESTPAPTAPVALPNASTPTPTPAEPVAPSGPPVLSFAPPSIQVPLSAPLEVTLRAQNMTDLFAAPFHIKWDPKLLRLNQVTPGALIGDSGPQANPPSINIRNDTGEAAITISRITGAPGVNGSGDLAKLMFMAVGKGSGTIVISDVGLRNSKQEPIAAGGPTMAVTVQ